jgi:hypothetical protein
MAASTSFDQVNKMLDSAKARITTDITRSEKYKANTFEARVGEGGEILTNKMLKKKCDLSGTIGRMECVCGQTILASTKKEMAFKLRLHSKVCPNEKK